MIGVDANILVRYAVKDDPQQTAQATDFLAKHRCLCWTGFATPSPAPRG
jgi:predicted nucleic-acid-binding protein